jgi:hypothetical protein
MEILSRDETGEGRSTKALRKRKPATLATTNKRLPLLPPSRSIPDREAKPLPSPPCHTSRNSHADSLPSKPLPVPPVAPVTRTTVDYRSALLWAVFFCVWFLLIVLLLPVIMERDAMPGLNRWLRSWVHDLMGVTRDETWSKDEV